MIISIIVKCVSPVRTAEKALKFNNFGAFSLLKVPHLIPSKNDEVRLIVGRILYTCGSVVGILYTAYLPVGLILFGGQIYIEAVNAVSVELIITILHSRLVVT